MISRLKVKKTSASSAQSSQESSYYAQKKRNDCLNYTNLVNLKMVRFCLKKQVQELSVYLFLLRE